MASLQIIHNGTYSKHWGIYSERWCC